MPGAAAAFLRLAAGSSLSAAGALRLICASASACRRCMAAKQPARRAQRKLSYGWGSGRRLWAVWRECVVMPCSSGGRLSWRQRVGCRDLASRSRGDQSRAPFSHPMGLPFIALGKVCFCTQAGVAIDLRHRESAGRLSKPHDAAVSSMQPYQRWLRATRSTNQVQSAHAGLQIADSAAAQEEGARAVVRRLRDAVIMVDDSFRQHVAARDADVALHIHRSLLRSAWQAVVLYSRCR